jgi:acetoacetate decarboxylase
MTSKGRLSIGNHGFSMPIDAPLYPTPPYPYKDVESFVINYETDEEAALNMLPEELALTETPTAMLMFVQYPFCALGPYEEVILGIHCHHEGNARLYIPHIVVNNEVPLAAGREIWGFPKKLATITIESKGDGMLGQMQRPEGNLICSMGFRPEQRIAVSGESTDGYSMSLRLIPSSQEGEKPTVAELIETHSTTTQRDLWTGTGWITFHCRSNLDPWHLLSVKKILSANYSLYDMVLGFGRPVQ